jgi:hypothetical protein
MPLDISHGDDARGAGAGHVLSDRAIHAYGLEQIDTDGLWAYVGIIQRDAPRVGAGIRSGNVAITANGESPACASSAVIALMRISPRSASAWRDASTASP